MSNRTIDEKQPKAKHSSNSSESTATPTATPLARAKAGALTEWLATEGGSAFLERAYDLLKYHQWERADIDAAINELVNDGVLELELTGRASIRLRLAAKVAELR